ncbi:Flp family type IVb pilin [Nocardioides halotolerans]|jgi:pilus assembly protein Flp/PilA|uniref:Flp family type IVb pilin n=1 Tax=Nocardioides halotolerans TaxID=433660 RepID=UPI00055B628E|nr:Flp family type IVb pilin [Nocardioides halotolerans]
MHEPRLPSERSEEGERSERGASAVEYGLLIAGIAALIVVVVFAFGGGARGLFHGSCSDIFESQGAGSCP